MQKQEEEIKMTKEKTRSILAWLLCLSFIFSMSIVALAEEAAPIKVLVDEKELKMELFPIIEKGRVLVPARDIFEALGAKISWDEITRTVRVSKEDTTIKLTIDKSIAKVNGKIIKLDTPARISNNHTLVPLRFVSLAMGCDVDFIDDTRTAVVTTKNSLNMTSLDYAVGFSIKDLGDGNKLVIDGDGRKFLLVPKENKVPKGYESVDVIRTPIDKVLFASTTQVSKVNALGMLDSVLAVTTDKDDWYIEEIKKGIEEGKITYVGRGSSPDFERIQAVNPQLAVVYTGNYPQEKLIEKLKELSIPYIVDNEYMETSGFGRMEWIKFYGALYNKSEEAERYFNNAIKEVNRIKERIKGKARPKVIWASFYKGKVYVPQGGSYAAEMIENAGGDYVMKDIGKDEPSSETLTMEEFYARAMEADIFIYSSTAKHGGGTIEQILEKCPIIEDIKPIKEGKVWQFQPWWWQSIDKTHEIIEDLAGIFNPSGFKEHRLDYLRLVPNE